MFNGSSEPWCAFRAPAEAAEAEGCRNSAPWFSAAEAAGN
jgi:hypothetical protein